MKTMMSAAVLVLFVSLSFAQQTDDQKRLMAKHKKVMEEATANNVNLQSVTYLVRRKSGVPIVEDQIIKYRQENKMRAWNLAFGIYTSVVHIEDIPDKMIGEFVYRMENRKKYPLTHQTVIDAGEFGTRGKDFLPVLEAIKDEATTELLTRSVRDAIRNIKGDK